MMPLGDWSVETHDYALSAEYAIRRAEPEEWGVYCSVYYNAAYNGFFKEEGFANSRPNAFWIYKEGFRVGGVRMSPEVLYHLFWIPPFQEALKVLKLLKRLLIHWSDDRELIKTYEVLPDQAGLFAMAGFWPDPFRCRWMQRPTEIYDVVWEDGLRIESPEIFESPDGGKQYARQDEIARCDFDSFRGGFEAISRKKQTLADFMPAEDPNYTNEVLRQASTLVFDRESGRLIANCRLCLQDQFAAVYSIGVIPTYRGKGLATRMLQRALTLIKEHYPLLRLYVMEGNDAEAVYTNLGFKSGVQEIQTMSIPARR
jgi:ribosomal protein S18 acetylase RimI-like enzyme